MEVQSLLFSKDAGWTVEKAKEWAKSHGYKHGKVHVTGQYIRIRQFSPKGSKVERTITFGHGIRAVIAREGQNMASTKEARRRRHPRRARETAAPTATEAKRRHKRRKTREAPVATEAKRRKRSKHRRGETASKRSAAAKKGWRKRKHGRTREAPVATEARRHHRRRKTREARRPVSGQVMEARRHKRKRKSHRSREAWHGNKAEHRKAAKKGWRKRKHGGGSRSAKRSAASKKAWRTRRARARGKFIGPVTKRRRKGHMFEEAHKPRRRRHRAKEVVAETKRRRRRHTRESGMFEARSRRGKSGRGMYAAELALAIGTGSLAYIVANGFDRFLATYNPTTDPTKLPNGKFTSDGTGTLANALNIASHPSWLRLGAGFGMAALPAVGSIFVEHPMLRSSLEGAAVGASVQFLQMLWSNVLVPLLAPKADDALIKKSFIARLYPNEVVAHLNMQAQHLAPPVTGLSGAEEPAPTAGVGSPDVGPFALEGPSYFPSAVEVLRAHAAGLEGGHESNRIETGIGNAYPSVAEVWRIATGGDTHYGRPTVQDVLTRTVAAVQGLTPAVQAEMPGIPPAQAEQVAVTALTQPDNVPGAIQQVFPTMPVENQQEFGRRLHHHVRHHHNRMRGGEAPPAPPGMPAPPGEMFGGLVEEARRRFPHMRHEHHMQIAGHILTEPQNIVGALKRAMPNEPENVLREHARHFHKHVAHIAEAVAPGAPPPPEKIHVPEPPKPEHIPEPPHGHVAGLGDTGLGYVVRGVSSFGRNYSPFQTSQFAAHAYSQPWNLPGVVRHWMPQQNQAQHYEYARQLYPYVQQQYGQQYGQQAENLYSIVQSILPEVPATQLQALIAQLQAAPYNMIALLQQVLPNVPEYLLQYRAQKLHPYFAGGYNRPAPPRPAPPTLSGAGVDQPPPLQNAGPPDLPPTGPNGKPVGEDCGCGEYDTFLGLAGEGEAANEPDRLIIG